MRILLAILTLGFGVMAVADADVDVPANCKISAEEHIGVNVGYEVGYDCKVVQLIGNTDTRLRFVNGAKGECHRLSQNGLNTISFSMDATKEDTRLGNGCQVRAVYSNGWERTISIRAVEN